MKVVNQKHVKARAVFDSDELATMPGDYVELSNKIHQFCIPAMQCLPSRDAEVVAKFRVHNEEGTWFGTTIKTLINSFLKRARYYGQGYLELPEEGEDVYVFKNKLNNTKLTIKIDPNGY